MKKRFSAMLSLGLAAAFFFYVIFQMSLFNTLSQPLITNFQLSTDTFGNIAALYFYIAALCLLPAGLMLDTFNSKHILLSLLLIVAIATFCVAWEQTTWALIIYRIASGLGNGFAFLLCMRTAVLCFPNNTGVAMGLSVTLGMSGGIVQPYAEVLYQQLGWQHFMLGNSIACFLLALMVILGYRLPKPKELAETKPHLNFTLIIAKLKAVTVQFNNWLCAFYTGLMNFPISLLGAAWGTTFILHKDHFSPVKSTLIVSMIFLGMITSSPIIGYLIDRYRRQRGIFMLVGAVAGFLLIGIAIVMPVTSIGLGALLFFLLGIASTCQIISFPIVSENNSLTNTSTAMGLLSFTFYLIGALGNNIFSWLVKAHQHWTHQVFVQTADLNFGMGVLLTGFLVSAILAIWISAKSKN